MSRDQAKALDAIAMMCARMEYRSTSEVVIAVRTELAQLRAELAQLRAELAAAQRRDEALRGELDDALKLASATSADGSLPQRATWEALAVIRRIAARGRAGGPR